MAKKKAAQGPAGEASPHDSKHKKATHPFLEEAANVFESLDRASLDLTGQELIDRLQEYLSGLKGKSFGSPANRFWANMLNHFMETQGLRVACIGKNECNKPSLLRYSRGGTGREGHRFRTEHLDTNGRQAKHGGAVSIPSLKVTCLPLNLQPILDELTPPVTPQ
jgi:hypothetical protein